MGKFIKVLGDYYGYPNPMEVFYINTDFIITLRVEEREVVKAEFFGTPHEGGTFYIGQIQRHGRTENIYLTEEDFWGLINERTIKDI